MKYTKKRQTVNVVMVVLLMTAVIRLFFIDTFYVQGDSMSPAILSGDYIFVDKTAYYFKNPARNDVIVTEFRAESQKVIKRIIGMPRERIEITKNNISIKENRDDDFGIVMELPFEEFLGSNMNATTTIELDPEEYFIIGDNYYGSSDSRELGPIDKRDIEGRVIFIFRKNSPYITFL